MMIGKIKICRFRIHFFFFVSFPHFRRFPRSSFDYIPPNFIIPIEIISLIGLSYGLFYDIVIEIIRFSPDDSSNKRFLGLPIKSHSDRMIRRILICILLLIYSLKWLELLIQSIALAYEVAHPYSSIPLQIKSSVYLNTFPLECIFALIIEKKYYSILKTIIRTLPRFCSLIAQLTLLIVVFTGILLILINHESPGAKTHYDTFSDSIWTNINVMNAADWPTPFVDLYKVHANILLRLIMIP